MTSEPMVIVRIVGGSRDGERFATRLAGLTEGEVFRYFDDEFTYVRDPVTGRWGAIPSPRTNDPGPSRMMGPAPGGRSE